MFERLLFFVVGNGTIGAENCKKKNGLAFLIDTYLIAISSDDVPADDPIIERVNFFSTPSSMLKIALTVARLAT